MNRKLVALVLAGALGLGLAACAKPQGQSAAMPETGAAPAGIPVDGGTLNLSMFAAPKGVFNPVVYEDLYDGNVLGLVFNGMLRINEKLEYVPDLAESYWVSEDNRTVSFKLRQDVKWHDGEPFTARDVAFTIKTILDPNYPGVRAGDYMDIVGAKAFKAGTATDVAGIQVDGDYDISFTTNEPYASIIERLSFPVIPAHIFAGTDIGKIAEHPATRQPIGTGPFKFVSYTPGQFVQLERNPDYFRGSPHIEKIIYKVVNQEVALGQLQAGELDYIPAKAGDLSILSGMPSVQVFEQPSFAYQYMGFNTRHPDLADVAVRQAFMYAINRQGVVDQLLKGHGTVLNSHMIPISWAYDNNEMNPYPYDPAKAEALLQGAGYTKGPDGIYARDGRPLEFTLKYPAGSKIREQSAPLIQDNLARVGVKINLEMLEFATLAQQVFDEQKADLWLMGWSVTVDPDPAGIFLVTPDNKWAQVTGWNPPKNAELIQAAVRVLKQEERRPIYVEWGKLVNTELPYAFLYSENDLHAVSTRVKGLKPDVRGPLWNIEELWLDS